MNITTFIGVLALAFISHPFLTASTQSVLHSGSNSDGNTEYSLIDESELPEEALPLDHIEDIPEWTVVESSEGVASWYGPGFHGRTMANGETYDQYEVLVAHRTFPLGSTVRVTNLTNGKSIIAPVKDRGPYVKYDGVYVRHVDLSYAAAREIGMVGAGLADVRIELLSR